MDGGQWGDTMRAIDRVRERVAGLEDAHTSASNAIDGLLRRLGKLEDEAPDPTLRDRFAMAALAGAMPAFFGGDYDDMAGTCYQVADAMLRGRASR